MNVLVYAKFVDILRLVNPIYILRLTSDACSCVVASVPASSTGKFLLGVNRRNGQGLVLDISRT